MAEKEYDHIKQREEVFQLMGLDASMHVLDLGTCGCECMSLVLVKNGFRVTAVDNSEKELRESRKYAGELGLLGQIVFRKDDAARLSFEDDSFDAVVAYNLLHHCDDIGKVVSEMFRVCKQGGKIIFADLNAMGRKQTEHPKDSGFLSRVERLIRRHTNEFEIFDLDFTRVWIVTAVA